MKQEKSENYALFSEKTEMLARILKMNLDELPHHIGISKAMFYAYRTGKYRISEKAWRKLEALELATLAKQEPVAAVDAVEKSLTAEHYGERPLDDFLKRGEEVPEKIAAALLHAAGIAHVWLMDTDSLTAEYIQRLEAIASGQPLDAEQKAEFPMLQQTVRRRREKLDFMRRAVTRAVRDLLGEEAPNPRSVEALLAETPNPPRRHKAR